MHGGCTECSSTGHPFLSVGNILFDAQVSAEKWTNSHQRASRPVLSSPTTVITFDVSSPVILIYSQWLEAED